MNLKSICKCSFVFVIVLTVINCGEKKAKFELKYTKKFDFPGAKVDPEKVEYLKNPPSGKFTILGEFEVVSIIESFDGSELSFDDVLPELKKKASEVGADTIVLKRVVDCGKVRTYSEADLPIRQPTAEYFAVRSLAMNK
ncbi:MAG: hypothetical protein HY606_06000 [Planctomycetes bacterium]|nr:hypothetical protein [Planctomycetota bacterium]